MRRCTFAGQTNLFDADSDPAIRGPSDSADCDLHIHRHKDVEQQSAWRRADQQQTGTRKARKCQEGELIVYQGKIVPS